MKKFVTIMMLLASMTAGAQRWVKKTEPADVIKGTSERVYYSIDMDSVTTFKMYADNGEWYLRTRFFRNGFKLKIKAFQRQVQEIQTRATFGFIDNEGNIAQPTLNDVKMTATERAQVIGFGKFTSNDALEVSNYLKNGRGCVQIIAALHMGGEFNMKIPCIPDEVK